MKKRGLKRNNFVFDYAHEICIFWDVFFHSSGDVIQRFHGNKNCPLFSSCAPTYSTEKFVSTLICSEKDKVCTERPIACRRNASFILDTARLDNRDDYKADGNGSFRQHGKKVEHVVLDDEGDVIRLDYKPKEFGIFGIDVTYSISDFYITTTSLHDR